MVGTISLYRRLSLSFVEYMLEQPINGEEHGDAGKEEKEGGGTEVFTVRVEVVYGCRMERNFCTDFIAKGSVELSMSKQSKALLSSYRERLLKLLAAGNAGKQQVVPMDTLMLVEQQRASANCLFCNGQLRYICTICGARLCGAASCVWKPFVGYPHGCSSHKAQL
ncbi:hypothetical protein ERJ75_001173000 [Trypanosoma vivax]|nr:hypothetical protein ERJ75_001173000 [Trypanosoma vivax]